MRWIAGWMAMLLCAASYAAEPANDGVEAARNVVLLGRDDLQGRPSYQPVIHDQGGRRLLYVGHHPGRALNPLTGKQEANGTSIVDVTDPKQPRYLAHVPATPLDWPADADDFVKTGGQHVQVCDGSVLPQGRKGRVYMLRNQGNAGNEVVDVTDPARARFVVQVARIERTKDEHYPLRTHKNWWDCASGMAYLPSSMSAWSSIKSLRIFDLGDPEHPKFIRDYGLVGTEPGSKGTPAGGAEGIHEATLYRDRVVLTYGSFDHGVLQILDRRKLLEGDPRSADPMQPTPENLRYPLIAQLEFPDYWGAHSAKPVLGIHVADYAADQKGAVRDFLVVTSEGVNYPCNAVRHLTFMVDISDERHPFPVANFQVPAHQGAIDFCKRGTFGPHAPNAAEAFGGRLIALSYFAAGVRIVDIRDPFKPVEVGFFIPAATARTGLALPQSNPPPDFVRVATTNNVEADDRGLLYAVDRANTGLHILALSGEAAAIAAGK